MRIAQVRKLEKLSERYIYIHINLHSQSECGYVLGSRNSSIDHRGQWVYLIRACLADFMAIWNVSRVFMNNNNDIQIMSFQCWQKKKDRIGYRRGITLPLELDIGLE